MTTTPNAHQPTDAEVRAAVADAFDPDECDSCDYAGQTCWECAEDAIAELIETL